MELTPIIIRGKRHRKGEPALPMANKKQDRKGEKTIKTKKTKKMVHKPKASCLELELPLEITEHIFWMSENVNLPRASHRLGLLLSGPSTRRETFLEAFGPTWDVWFGCIRRTRSLPTVHSYAGWETDSARFGGNSEFQSDLLQYSWVNISFILSCWDLWAQRHGRARHFQHTHLWGSPETANKLELDIPPSDRRGGGGIGTAVRRPARDYFLHDYDAFLAQAGQAIFDEQKSWIEVHRSTKIPESLLTGPWDEAAQQKFFWLVRAGARLQPEQTWETTLEGYRNTMRGGDGPNMTVLRLLFIIGSFRDWPAHVASAELAVIAAKREQGVGTKGFEDLEQYPMIIAMVLNSPAALETGRVVP